MNIPVWFKPGVYGGLIGAVVVGVLGFTWGGWVTGGTARDRAMAMAHDNVVAALAPVCLDMAQADPERIAKLALIREARTYERRNVLMDAGWATVPGAEAPDRDIAKACLGLLDVDASPEPPETAADKG